MNVDFVAYSKKSLSGIDKNLTELLKVDAKTAGWPNNIIRQLKVSVKDLKIVVYYPESYTTQIDDLEYGNGTDSPRPIFRRFVTKNMNFIGGDLANSSLDYLFEQGVLP
jgi:hypothetical protein